MLEAYIKDDIIIPYDKVVCAQYPFKDRVKQKTLLIKLEGNNELVLNDKEADEFYEKYKTYLIRKARVK